MGSTQGAVRKKPELVAFYEIAESALTICRDPHLVL